MLGVQVLSWNKTYTIEQGNIRLLLTLHEDSLDFDAGETYAKMDFMLHSKPYTLASIAVAHI